MRLKLLQLLFFISIFSATEVYSQFPTNLPKEESEVTDEQLEAFIKEAESRGLNEDQIETMAKLKGFSSSDIASIKSRIKDLKSNKTAINAPQTPRTQGDQGAIGKKISTTEKKDSIKVVNSRVFGMSLFANKSIILEPNINIPTPENYVLGTNDGLSIDITGYAYQHYSVIISPEGTIKIESLAPIFVSGLTVSEAKKKIVERLKTIFGGLRNGTLNCDVTLSELKSITVTLAGEIQNPGSYTLSSMSTIFNALYVAGGPTEKGTFRTIQLIRKNKIITDFDIYDILISGNAKNNEVLKDQDVIFIPIANKRVEIIGEVITPAIFELKNNENLAEAIKIAGGFKDLAYKKTLNIQRYSDTEKKLLTVENQNFESTYLQDGDKITIGGLINTFENKVTITGAVKRPGDFSLNENINTLRELIEMAGGLKEDAYKKKILIYRRNGINDIETISLNLNSDEIDFGLQKEDEILIKSFKELRDQWWVTISGAVNSPGFYEYTEKMTISDLVFLAGGFQESAYLKNIEIGRRLNERNAASGMNTIVIKTELDKIEDKNEIILQPYDEIYIRFIPNYEVPRHAEIYGLVAQPGNYVIKNANEKIADLIVRAGGLSDNAYLKGAKFYRKNRRVSINLERILKEPDDYNNLVLRDGDSLYVPQIEETVTLIGEFLNPIQVTYSNKLKFTDYISQAGGFTDSAYIKKTYVIYANGRTDRTRNFFGARFYPKMERGMEIIAPVKYRTKMKTSEILALSSAITSMGFLIIAVLRNF